MERDKKTSLNRGIGYSSVSGVIIAVGIGLHFLLGSYPGWEAMGAGMLAGAFLVVGPIVGLILSAIVAGLIYSPVYIASSRVTGLPLLLLPITGSVLGLTIAVVIGMRLENLILPVYIIFAFWGALGGLLFVIGAKHNKFA